MQEQEKLYVDILETKRKLEKNKIEFICAISRFLFVAWRCLSVAGDLTISGCFFQITIWFFVAYVVSKVFVFVYEAGLLQAGSTKSAINGIVITPLLIMFAGLFFSFSLFLGLIMFAIVISPVLILCDIYLIFSRPRNKKKLSEMQEQYAQSMLQIEYE